MGFQMAVWFLLACGLGTVIVLWNRKKSELSDQTSSQKVSSNMVVYFDPIKGEGHLFVGGIVVIIFVSFFFYEFAQIMRSIFFGSFS